MPSIVHTHTYVRYKSRPGYFRCDSPDCTHFIDKESVLGKISLCTTCGEQFLLSREDLKRARPKCLNCSNTKKAKQHKKVQKLTESLGTDSFNPLGLFKPGPQSTLPLPGLEFISLRDSLLESEEESELENNEIVEEKEPEDD